MEESQFKIGDVVCRKSDKTPQHLTLYTVVGIIRRRADYAYYIRVGKNDYWEYHPHSDMFPESNLMTVSDAVRMHQAASAQ